MLVDIKQEEVEVELKLDEDTTILKLPQAGDEVKDATARVKEHSGVSAVWAYLLSSYCIKTYYI